MNLTTRLFNQILQLLPRRAARWSRQFSLATIVGILGGLSAVALHWGLTVGSELLAGRFAHLDQAEVVKFKWGVLLLPAAGGLLSGLIALWLGVRSAEHGTDLLTRAFHRNLGEMHLKGPSVKAATAVGVISCGGSAGPEGPIAALGAGIGSTIGKLFDVTPRERRIMLVAGCAAGIGAIFQCPLGGALFAAGVLYKEPEFESDAIVPSFVASVVGYTTFMLFPGFGHHLLIGVNHLRFESPLELIPYAVLGPLCGLVSMLLSTSLRTVERAVDRVRRIPRWMLPALGGLATGALACLLPQVMDGQYRFIQNALDGNLFEGAMTESYRWQAGLFAMVVIGKCIATAFTVGSGGSGGVLGPSVFIGGATGAFVGALGFALFPNWFPESLRQSLIPVGMAGVLAAGMRVPMASVVMVTEMTGSYGLIVPLMLVCSSAYVIGRRQGLNKEQVRGAAESPAHAADAVIHILEAGAVSAVMDRNWPLVASPDISLGELVKRIRPGTRPVFAIIDKGKIVGLISVPDIQRMMEEPAMADALIAADMMTENLSTVYGDDDLYQALNVFTRTHHDVLPVVSHDREKKWLGMLTRRRIFEIVQSQVVETQKQVIREHAGLSAIEQEGQLQQLVMGVSRGPADRIKRLLVPLEAVGHSLRDADFRNKFGAQVIAIEQPDGTIQCPPDINAPLQTNQRLVAIVWQDDIRGEAGS